MSRSISQAAAPRRLARVYCRILGLAVPAALAACADSLAPAAAGDPSAPAAAATEAVAPSADLLGALASDRIAFTDFTANHGSDIWSMGPEGGNLAHLTAFTGIETDPSWSYDHKHIAFTR